MTYPVYRLNITEDGKRTITEQRTVRHAQQMLITGKNITEDNWISLKDAILADRSNGFVNMENLAKWERDHDALVPGAIIR